MENRLLLLSIIRLNMNCGTLWVVIEVRDNMESVNHIFSMESSYADFVNPLLEKCGCYRFRSFDIRNSARHNFDGQVFCPYDFSFEKPESAELFSDYR